MSNSLRRVCKPVQREGTERYLMLTLVSFASSVIFTRLFLQVTDYPQVGSGQLHIAHGLWGGLLLFAASLLPLLFANRWAYAVGALLGVILYQRRYLAAEADHDLTAPAPTSNETTENRAVDEGY